MNRTIKRKISGHYFTRARIAAAAVAKIAAGDITAGMALWNRLEVQQTKPLLNQRQKRKLRRQRFAAGDRRAFA